MGWRGVYEEGWLIRWTSLIGVVTANEQYLKHGSGLLISDES